MLHTVEQIIIMHILLCVGIYIYIYIKSNSSRVMITIHNDDNIPTYAFGGYTIAAYIQLNIK